LVKYEIIRPSCAAVDGDRWRVVVMILSTFKVLGDEEFVDHDAGLGGEAQECGIRLEDWRWQG
jgi:hypothetical protein